MKFSAAVVLAAATSASAFVPQAVKDVHTVAFMEKGAGGMFDTRNPDSMQHEDPRKSISAAPSFEEYMKNRGGGAVATAPVPPAPAAPAWTPPAAAAPAWTPPAPAAPAWTPPAPAGEPEMGAGGMFDTRNPDSMEHEDPRKSISAAPSFEEYMKNRGGGVAAAAPEPAASAWTPPAPAAPAAPAWGAPAAAAPEPVASSGPFTYGEYDEKLWDNDAKKDVYAKWDPNSPRSTRNFNPFETFDGNSPDASGIYPGEMRYKDPKRPDVNFQQMMQERAEIEERNANPKPGAVPGCPGCKN